MDNEHRTTLRLPDALYQRARARYGTRGIAPRLRELLELDMANDHTLAAEHTRAPDKHNTRPAAPKRQQDHADTPRVGGPCPRCGTGTLRPSAGKLRCSMVAGHTWPNASTPL